MIDQLIANIKKTNAPIVVGLDPMMKFIPEQIQKAAFAEYGETLKGAAEAIWQYNKGIFVLVKTSNPSSGEFQDRLVDGRPLYEIVGEKVAEWGSECMGSEYSNVGAVVGATYPEMGKALRKVMPKSYILVPGYGAQGGKGADLVHFFNEDGLGAIVNSSRGIIAAYQQEKYAQFGAANYADASRQAVIDMREDIAQALQGRK